MLPSLRPSYCLTLLPDSVTLSQARRASRFGGWIGKWTKAATPLNTAGVTMNAVALPEATMVDASSLHGAHPPWQRALQVCARLLAEVPAGSQLTVVVSNQWLRYKLLPAMPPMQSHTANLAIARSLFMDTYGQVAATWQIALEPLPQGEYQFACAIDSSLLDAITAMALQSGSQLISVQPAMMQLYNRLCRQMAREVCGLVQVEAGRIHLAMMRDGGWLGLTACASQSQDWPSHLLALLQRETLLLSDAPLPPGKLFVDIALASGEAAAWPALQDALSGMGWQGIPVFHDASGVTSAQLASAHLASAHLASANSASISKPASPAEAWVGR